MRIERIRIDAFGPLAKLDTGPTPLEPLVVVLGPNEAGKSTLFSFLTTALYGFQPATRDRNPHVPWGSDEARGAIQLRLGPDGHAEVERRLRSSPSGSLTMDGRTRELRNQPLPWVEHVPRAVFRQVFAVTLADLAGLDEETWARIQDRVLGSMGATDLRPARSVAEALEREASEIWRPNRRGNQRLRDTQAEIRALRPRRSGALERDRTIRTLVEEREGHQRRLAEMRAERERDRVAVERVQELLPVKQQLDRVAALRTEGGLRDELSGLPSDPQARLDELESESERVRGRLASLDRDLDEPVATLARFDDDVRKLLDHREKVASFVTRAAAVAPDQLHAPKLRHDVAELESRVKAAADHLLCQEWNDEMTEAVSGVPIDLLRDRVERLDATGAGDPAADRERATARNRSSFLAWGPSGGLSATGLALLAWGVSGGPIAATTIGAAFLAAGLTTGFVLLRAKARSERESDDRDQRKRARAALETKISELLTGLPIREEYLAPPRQALVDSLQRLQRSSEEWHDRARALGEVTERLKGVESEAATLSVVLGRNATPGVEDLARQLEREMRDAERAQDSAENARRETDRIGRERDVLTAEAEAVGDRLAQLRELLQGLGEGDDGLQITKRRMETHARADQIEDELDRMHPDLAELTARIHTAEARGESWSVDSEDLAIRRGRIDELEKGIEELVARVQEVEGETGHLRQMETVDAVDSEIASLQERETLLTTEHDRKWVLAQLVREADRAFREEHQPDLLRRASSYLERLTGGRYDRILVDELADGDLFQLAGPGLPAPIPLAPPISTATLEQAYLSLRLAIVDHLDHGERRLPLFIDEAFVNWDDDRRARGLEVLAELSLKRQVFAFTCHPEMAKQLEGRGGRILRLEVDA